MAEKIENLQMQPTTNGIKVTWMCVEGGQGTYGNSRYEPYEMGFKDGEEDKAMKCFKEQKDKIRKQHEEEESQE